MVAIMSNGTQTRQPTRPSETSGAPTGEALLVPTLTILAHPQPDRVGEMATLPMLRSGQTVELSRLTPIFAPPGRRPHAPLDDSHLSRKPLLLLPGTQPGEVILALSDSGTKVEIDEQKLEDDRVFSSEDLERGVVLVLGRRVALVLHLHHAVPSDLPSFNLVGESTALLGVRREIDLVARLDVPVLLLGESGTGKELIARAIHSSSRRRDRDFLAVNMAAIPATLAASELFGAVRGAYTGADKKKDGYFLHAHEGTLLLDEIGDTPQEVQPLLLRALENGEIQPVGAASPRQVDVRLIAATDADLESLVASGAFRRPLLHRLASYVIHVPPLRARRCDFGRLFFTFLREELCKMGWVEKEWQHDGRPWPSARLMARLAVQSWPGNVRELKNTARRLAIARQGGVSDLLESHPGSTGNGVYAPPEPTPDPAFGLAREITPEEPVTEALDDTRPNSDSYPTGWRPAFRKPSAISGEELLAALREHRFDLKKTAEAMNISRASLYNLVEKQEGVRKSSQLSRAEIEAALASWDGDLAEAALALEVSLHGLKLRIKALGLR